MLRSNLLDTATNSIFLKFSKNSIKNRKILKLGPFLASQWVALANKILLQLNYILLHSWSKHTWLYINLKQGLDIILEYDEYEQ